MLRCAALVVLAVVVPGGVREITGASINHSLGHSLSTQAGVTKINGQSKTRGRVMPSESVQSVCVYVYVLLCG